MGVFFERSNGSGGGENHAVGEVVRQCGLCQDSNMVLKRNRDGNYMVGCLGFPQCRNVVWLPGSIAEAAVTSNCCNSCTPGPVYLIQFTFRQLEIPPNYNANHLGCIGGCDAILRQLTEICGTGSRIPARGRGTPSSNVQRGNTMTGQSVCILCQQVGHSSNDCPSQVVGSRSARRQQSGEPSVSCSNCSTPCVLRTANTANNRGRKFYKCQSQECNFFLWEDNADNGNRGNTGTPWSNNRRTGSAASNPNPDGNTGRGRGRGRGQTAGTTFVSATGEPISDRRCFVCGDPSHFANVCPNRGA